MSASKKTYVNINGYIVDRERDEKLWPFSKSKLELNSKKVKFE